MLQDVVGTGDLVDDELFHLTVDTGHDDRELIAADTAEDIDRTETLTEFALAAGETDVYEIVLSDLSAETYGKTVTAVFERDDAQVGNALTYSVNAYVQAKQNDGNAALAVLVRALYCYGASAAAYAAAA